MDETIDVDCATIRFLVVDVLFAAAKVVRNSAKLGLREFGEGAKRS